jgi:peptidoglycan/LPS O-acetylase OafA/YrhL
VDRRSSALGSLVVFVVCTVTAIVVSASRPALHQGIAPTVVQSVGYALAVAGALLLLLPLRAAGAERRPDGSQRTSGAVVLGAVALLVLMDLFVLDGVGPDIGAGAIRLVGLVVIVVVAVRLAAASGSARRHSSR